MQEKETHLDVCFNYFTHLKITFARCKCGYCTSDVATPSLFCCCECPQLEGKKLNGESCVIDLRGFQLNCLEPDVLDAVYHHFQTRLYRGQRLADRMRYFILWQFFNRQCLTSTYKTQYKYYTYVHIGSYIFWLQEISVHCLQKPGGMGMGKIGKTPPHSLASMRHHEDQKNIPRSRFSLCWVSICEWIKCRCKSAKVTILRCMCISSLSLKASSVSSHSLLLIWPNHSRC